MCWPSLFISASLQILSFGSVWAGVHTMFYASAHKTLYQCTQWYVLVHTLLYIYTQGTVFEVQARLCISAQDSVNPSLVLVQPRKTCPVISERLLMGRKESDQTIKIQYIICTHEKFCTVKPVLSGHSKIRQDFVFKTNYHLMQVKSIAECSKRAFCNTYDLH